MGVNGFGTRNATDTPPTSKNRRCFLTSRTGRKPCISLMEKIDWEGAAAADLANSQRGEKVLRCFLEMGVFERTLNLLGFQNAFLAMIEEPESFKALIDALADYKIKIIDKLITYYAPDEFFAHDDLGTANGAMISQQMYEELLKPAHCRIRSFIRSHGCVHTHHSCGKMETLLGELVDVGIDMINPLQPINDWETIAATYGGRIAYNVGAETLANYEGADEQEMRRSVRRIIDVFGPTNRLIIDCFISNVNCMDNMAIILDEARSYGGSFYH